MTALSGEHLTIDEIIDYRLDCDAALRAYFSVSSAAPARFTGMTRSEIDDELRSRVAELELSQSLVLLAAIEAIFRVDFTRRCKAKKRTPLTREFLSLEKLRGRWVRLDEDILEAWKTTGGLATAVVAEIRSALKLRHWLAHGRYWPPKLGRHYDFDALVVIADGLLASNLLLV